MAEFIGGSQNNVTSAFPRVEDAAAITELAVHRVHLTHFFFAEIKNQHGSNGLRDFLAVSSNVLYRSGADAPWNSAQALDSS